MAIGFQRAIIASQYCIGLTFLTQAEVRLGELKLGVKRVYGKVLLALLEDFPLTILGMMYLARRTEGKVEAMVIFSIVTSGVVPTLLCMVEGMCNAF